MHGFTGIACISNGIACIETGMRFLSRVGAVVFDCDSTLSAIEGIDELAPDRRAEIEALTRAAMDGSVPLESVYGRRLDLIRPDRAQLEQLGRMYIERMVPDAQSVIAALHAENVRVRVVSGGLRPAVLALTTALGIDADDVAAVDIRFAADGSYAGFDEASPLARSGGKYDVVAGWRSDLGVRLMMVGDGVTDLEAAAAADVFVAYAGVVEREPVVARADAVIRSRSLAPVLPLALGGERPQDRRYHDVFDRGVSLLEAHARDHRSIPNS